MENIGRVWGLRDVAELRTESAWRIMAEASTPGRGDREHQMRRARRALDEGESSLADARRVLDELAASGEDVEEERPKVEACQSQLAAAARCWARHQGQQVPPIVCICPADATEPAAFCSADHSQAATPACVSVEGVVADPMSPSGWFVAVVCGEHDAGAGEVAIGGFFPAWPGATVGQRVRVTVSPLPTPNGAPDAT